MYSKRSRLLSVQRTMRQLSATVCILLFFTPVYAIEYETIDEIQFSVQSWLKHQYRKNADIHFNIGHIDKRLHLLKCPSKLSVSQTNDVQSTGNATITVRCTKQNIWRVYVPVKIIEYGYVLVAKHALPRGTYLQPDDVIKVKKDKARLHHGFFTNSSAISDMVSKRSLRKGQILTPSIISPPRLVKRGDSITILAKTGGLTIRVKGRALMDGKMGDRIRVKNVRSRRSLQATVVSFGTVRVSM